MGESVSQVIPLGCRSEEGLLTSSAGQRGHDEGQQGWQPAAHCVRPTAGPDAGEIALCTPGTAWLGFLS